MPREGAELIADETRFVQRYHSLSINRVSSSQLENLLHVYSVLTAYLYRYDGEVTQQIELYAPCLPSTSRRLLRTPLSIPVAGNTRLVDIKSELNEHVADLASGIVSISGSDGGSISRCHPGDKLLIFYDADFPIENWLNGHSIADITVLCCLNAEDISIIFKSRFESIDEHVLDSLSKHFYAFAQSAEREGDEIAVANLNLLTPEDIDFNALVSPEHEVFCRFEPPHLIVEKFSAAFPSRTALRFVDKYIDYETLNRRANQLAHYLREQGVEKGERCVVLIKPSFDTIVVMLAILKIGAVYVPVDYEYPAQRIQHVIKDSNPVAILCTSETEALLDTDISKIIVDTVGTTIAGYSSENLKVDIGPDDEAYVFYTSGTTGQPKGVVGTYKNLHHYVSVAKTKFSMGPHTIMPVVAKSSFSISFFETLTPLISGGTCLLLPRSDVLDVNRMIEVLREITMFHIGPSLLSRIIRKIKQDDPSATFPNIQHASSGGDMVPVELLHDLTKLFVAAEVFVIYGSSEIACMGCTYMLDRRHLPQRTLVGKAFPGMQVKVVDGDMNELPPGWKGEICFSGTGVTRGYQHKPELSLEKYFDCNNRRGYRTGDIGRVDSSGNIEMLGRGDFQVKISGIRVELAEIDYYLKKAPHVTEIIAKAFVTENGDTVIYACVVDALTMQQIGDVRRYLSNNLPEYMHPKGFLRIDKMPLNHNLKVDRKALPDPAPHILIRESDYAGPTTITERSLAQIWEDMLGIQPIGVDDDFFASGGTSIQGIDLLVAIEEKLNRTISINEFMQARTIRGLARYVDGCNLTSEEPESLIKLKQGSSDKTIFFIHDGEGDVLPYFSLSQRLSDDWSVFGIAPCARGYAKMTHTSFDGMVDFYVAEIKRARPEGPYILGGLCIGGFLAYCVGCKLQEIGEKVDQIILFDSHHIDATPIKGREHSERNERLMRAIAQGKHNSSLVQALRATRIILSKSYGYCRYRYVVGTRRIVRSLQIYLLKHGDMNCRLMQRFAPNVDPVIRYAESRYGQRPRFKGNITLFKATRKLHTLDELEIDDTPYSDIFEDEGLGWPGRFDGNLEILDIDAGHSTLLTPPYVYEIAKQLERLT